RLLPVPQCSTVELAETQRSVEHAAGEVGRICADVVDRLTSEIKRRSFDVLPERPRVAVLSVDVAAESLAQAGRIARALEALGWPHVCCLPDRPNHCHTAARLSAISEIEADLVLLVNSAAGALGGLLPAEMPVASWYLPGATIGVDLASRTGTGNVVFAASPEAFDALLEFGVANDALHRLDVAGDDTVFAPAELGSDERRRLGCDVAIVSDVPDDRAKALNISLASQITLCEAVRTIVANRADEYTASAASEMLESAERACRTELREATLREWFLTLIRTTIAPAAIARNTATTLLRLGVPLGIWGRNWHGLNADTDPRRGMIPDDAELNRIYAAARVVLFPLATPRAIQNAVDARLSGADVVCREPDAGFAQSYPSLAEAAGTIHFYRDMSGLTRIITTLLARAQQNAPETRVVPSELAGHTTAARLRELVAVMRARGNPKTASGA
ncbi:MAG: hypothetical protein IID36_12595, partial [Planctomycetes bacterium]|nr:hypothetical protein [Planctomycetota bacterium]